MREGDHLMPDFKPGLLDASGQRHMALSRWDNEGGAGLCGPQQGQIPEEALTEVPELTNTELVQLRVRVIALENLMITLLAEGSDRQLELAREMAAYISPRPGFTHHPLTVRAAAHMVNFVNRAIHYRSVDPVMTLLRQHRRNLISLPRCLMKFLFLPGCAANIAPRPVPGASSECLKDACAIRCLTRAPR